MAPLPKLTPPSRRIAAIDWMRGFVMLLMVIDHVSMGYHAHHLSSDSAAGYSPDSIMTGIAFFTRWISHICAPTFVFLAGTALAISVERKVARGVDAHEIDKDIFFRGAFIALLDPTLISLGSGKLIFQVLYAIGVSFMCMAILRRLSSSWLLGLAVAWLICGEWITSWAWPPESNAASIIAAFLVSTYSDANISVRYPLIPWLAVMMLGWVFGRYLLDYREGKIRTTPITVLLISGLICLAVFTIARYFNAYGNMWLWMYYSETDWVQWLHVSKYPPSLTFITLEIGLMCWILAAMMRVEQVIGVRDKGVLLVFGQTAMFFYLVHRLFLEGTSTYLGMDDLFEPIYLVYVVSAVILIALYPLCLWYRGFKKLHPNALWAKYI